MTGTTIGAKAALAAFQAAKGTSGDERSDMRDLLTEIMHLATAEGYDLDKLIDGAWDVFHDECETVD